MLDVVIVGGGITGLTVAYEIDHRGWTGLLLEARNRLGGKIYTVIQEGFIVELGPDAMVTLKPEALALCHELGLGDQIVEARSGPVWIWVRNRFYSIPSELFSLTPSPITVLKGMRWLDWTARLRAALMPLAMLLNPLRPGTDRSVAEAFHRWAGPEFTQWVVEPLLSGIYGGDVETLSLTATLPQVVAWSHRPFRHTLRSVLIRRVASRSPFRTLRGGLHVLVGRLRATLQSVEVKTGTRVVALHRDEAAWWVETDTGERWRTRTVCVTIPPRQAAFLFQTSAPDLAQALERAESTPVAVVAYAWPGSIPWEGTGFLVPRIERRWVVACTFLSQKWPYRVPEGWSLIRAFVTDTPESWQTMDDPTLARRVWEDLSRMLALPSWPHRVWVGRWPDGLPRYKVGHLQWLDTLERLQAAYPGIALVGAGYRGLGLSDCIRQARAVVGVIAPYVERRY